MAAIQMALLHEAEQELTIPMSYEEYLTAFDETTHAEWANGKAIVFMSPSIRHQRLFNFLYLLLGNFVMYFRLGELFGPPTKMKLAPNGSIREPDLLFVANENLHRFQEQRLDGAADLVIEIISPESVGRDRGEKFYEYQQAGVREYWLIDPRSEWARADFWVLDDRGKYQYVLLDANGVYRSTVLPGFWLDTHWLWNEDYPHPHDVLRQILGPNPPAAPFLA